MDHDRAKALLDAMMLIRQAEERIVAVYAEQQMQTPTHLSIGQEAVAVGVCQALQKADQVFASHRCHAAFLAKGGDYDGFFAELCGRAAGISRGRAGSAHLTDPRAGIFSSPILGGMIPVAVGAAWAAQLDGRQAVAVCFLGDAATEEGVFAESVNFAALKRLPVLFICENNLYSTSSPLRVRQPVSPIFERVRIPEMPTQQIDGNDAVGVYHAAAEAVSALRAGQGPIFIECLTYRIREHVGPLLDYGRGYRSQAEGDQWLARCPIARLKRDLLDRGVVTAEQLSARDEALARRAEAAYEKALGSPWPSGEELLSDVY